jgi:capsule polysaccharide export protein KpsE/RkpR
VTVASEEAKRNWASVRIVIEGLMLAAVLWSARTQVEMVTQVAVVQADIAAIRAQLADVPSLTQRVATNDARIESLKEQLQTLQQEKRQ